MQFIKYNNIQDFANENLKLILEKEWLNNLMIANCLEGLETEIEGLTLSAVTNNGKTELILLHRRPWHLLLYSPTNNASDELFEFVAKEYFKIDNNVNGVNAEKELARQFAKYYSSIAKKQSKLNFPMRILLLEKLNEPKFKENIIFRQARRDEECVLINFLNTFSQEALKEDLEEKVLKERLNSYFEKGYYVLEVNGQIVSQAVISRVLTKGKAIGEVFTPKEYRGKGYAYNLVYKISEKVLNEGAEYCVLYTDDNNPISNHIYEKIGYKRMVDTEDIKFL